MNFIEVCKNFTINTFWVLAAITQLVIVCALVVNFIDHIFHPKDKRDGDE